MNTETLIENAIEIRGLRRHFPGFDLGPLDMTIPRGSIYGFVGPNGAGKTTTLDLIFGMGEPEAGTITVSGLDHAADEVAVKRRAAYVGPEVEYAQWGRVANAARFVRGFYPETWDDALFAALLRQFQLDANAKIASLSFGSKTKLALVLALAHRPEVLVLDEPTTGLDAIAKQELFAQLLALVGDSERTVLISSHSLADVERFADHLGIIRDGVMLHEGPMNEIVERYCLVDLTVEEESFVFPGGEGLTVIRREKGRVRVLVDRRSGALESLKTRGGRDLRESPVTLEDLFVSLLKKPRQEPIS